MVANAIPSDEKLAALADKHSDERKEIAKTFAEERAEMTKTHAQEREAFLAG